MVNGLQCADLQGDRELGQYWERAFCRLAAKTGRWFSPLQIGREESAQAYGLRNGQWNQWTLPDVTVWTCPGEHHEIKHKKPTKRGSFGLEAYRLDSLVWFANETQQSVLYTIHNHGLNGGRLVQENKWEHWFTVNVLDLVGCQCFKGPGTSYVNGQPKKVLMYYWKADLWMPLADYWKIQTET